MTNWHDTHPTSTELVAVLGTNWAICRKTPRNLARYTRCLNRAEYEAAVSQSLQMRANNCMALSAKLEGR